ncbi:MAG: hypothetical protein AAGC96_16505 [Pseudomonadota bacterium]
MNRMSAAGAGATAILLSACATPPPTTPPVEASFTSASAQADVQKFVVLASRTYAYGPDRKRTEKKGVPCTIKGKGFQVRYNSPANVRLPVYGLNTSELSMTCQYEGSTRFEALSVRNLTAERIADSGSAGGLVGAIVAISISSARGNQPDDDYTYETPDMDLNRKPSSTPSSD